MILFLLNFETRNTAFLKYCATAMLPLYSIIAVFRSHFKNRQTSVQLWKCTSVYEAALRPKFVPFEEF